MGIAKDDALSFRVDRSMVNGLHEQNTKMILSLKPVSSICRLTGLSKKQFHVAFSLFLFLALALAKRNKRVDISTGGRIYMYYLDGAKEDVSNTQRG